MVNVQEIALGYLMPQIFPEETDFIPEIIILPINIPGAPNIKWM